MATLLGVRLCGLEGCEKKHYAKDRCQMHWQRVRLKGDPGPSVSWYERDDITYSAAHYRIRRAKGDANQQRCQHCDGPAAQWAYDWLDPDELVGNNGKQVGLTYSTKPEHYFPLCVPCHKTFDAENSR